MIPDRGFKAEPLYPATLQGIADFSIEWVATRDSGSLHKMNTVYDYLGVGCHEWLTDLEVVIINKEPFCISVAKTPWRFSYIAT